MNTHFSFQSINQKYRHYTVQGKIKYQPRFFITDEKFAILTFIIEDVKKVKIECVAFGEDATHFNESNLSEDKIYLISNAQAIENIKYRKTQHKMKLQLIGKTEIKEIYIQQYEKHNKICVINNKKRNSKKTMSKKEKKLHQLAIKNWFSN